jgi:hypothetical protein
VKQSLPRARNAIVFLTFAALAFSTWVPASSAAADPAASDYTCSSVQFADYLSETATATSEPFASSDDADCTAGGTRYPHTIVTLSGTANIRCGKGVTIVGTLTFENGSAPATGTSVALILERTASGAPGLLTTGGSQVGSARALMSNGVPFNPPTGDVCGHSGNPVRVSIDTELRPVPAEPAVTTFGDWVLFHEGYLLNTSQLTLAHGVPVTDGTGDCDPPDADITSAANQQAEDLREFAYNPVTCDYLLETGAPPASALAAAQQDDATAEGRIDYTEDATALTTAASGVGLYRAHYYFRSWYEDPLGIDVTIVGNSIDWHYNGLDVYPPVKATYHFHEYKKSGWGLFEHDSRGDWNLTRGTDSSYAHFANGSFPGCLGKETHVWFNRNNIFGYWNGAAEGKVHAKLRGLNAAGCIRALHFHYRLQRIS